MEVVVTVNVEDMNKEEQPETALTAYFTMVAVDKDGKPCPVPALEVRSDEERCLFEQGRERYLRYKKSKDVGDTCVLPHFNEQ